MKLKIKHFDSKVFKSKMEHLKNINFTLFVDDIPQSQDDLTDLNVLVLQEPNEYFGLHDWAIKNQNLFSLILTWDDKVFHHTYGDRNNIEDARIGKVDVFSPSQYGVAVENTQHRGYFTEKILDLFLLKTIPIYWGCSNIKDFFNPQGIIYITSIDEAIYKLNNILDADYYNKVLPAIEENHKKALQYVDYEQNIVDYITKIFTENGI